jgi:hypothetical protein
MREETPESEEDCTVESPEESLTKGTQVKWVQSLRGKLPPSFPTEGHYCQVRGGLLCDPYAALIEFAARVIHCDPQQLHVKVTSVAAATVPAERAKSSFAE